MFCRHDTGCGVQCICGQDTGSQIQCICRQDTDSRDNVFVGKIPVVVYSEL